MPLNIKSLLSSIFFTLIGTGACKKNIFLWPWHNSHGPCLALTCLHLDKQCCIMDEIMSDKWRALHAMAYCFCLKRCGNGTFSWQNLNTFPRVGCSWITVQILDKLQMYSTPSNTPDLEHDLKTQNYSILNSWPLLNSETETLDHRISELQSIRARTTFV